MFYSNEEYWEAMPPWMREGYHKNTLVFQVVQSAMASNLPPYELVSKCGEVLLRQYTELQQEVIDRAMNDPIVLRR